MRRMRLCCSRMEALLRRRRLRVTDCELVYESTFLTAISALENCLESILIEMVCGAVTTRRGQGCLVEARDRSVFHDVLVQGSRYQNYLPYRDEMLPLAKRYLVGGHPFIDVEVDDRELLANAMK